MRILFWTDGFWPRIGGIETQALQFVQGMQRRGHHYLVLAQQEPSNEIYPGISIQRFDFNATFGKRTLKNLGLIENYLEQVLNEFQPDIIHLNTCAGWSAFTFLLLQHKFRSPILLTMHSPFWDEKRENPLAERVSSSATQICSVSRWVLGEMESYVPASRGKLNLIYNGLSLPEIAPLALSFFPSTLLLVGRLSSEKGFEVAIQAFSLLKKNGSSARLSIVGDGPERTALENLVLQLHLEDSVIFTGNVPREKIPSLINQATLVVVPSYFESFGLVALEAMQLGRPVIASRVGGLPEVVSDGETGFLVPSRDPFALYKAMQAILEQPEKAVKMGIEGRKRVLEHFTIEKNLVAYEILYNKLAGVK